MRNSSKKAVRLQDGTVCTVSVYMRKLAKALSKTIEQENNHMKMMSDIYQELGLESVNKYYEKQSKKIA